MIESIVDMGCETPASAKAVFNAAKELATTHPDSCVFGFGVIAQLEEAGCDIMSLPDNLVFHACQEVVPMDAGRTGALKAPESTMHQALNCLRNGSASAIISAGNTGAYVAAAAMYLERISDDLQVPLGTYMPLINPRSDRRGALLLDVGGCPDAKADVIALYPELGAGYARFVYGVDEPVPGLVNIGAERGKGNALYKEVQKLLGDSCPNVEPKPLMKGEVDVAVMDGHTGNLVIKLLEAAFGEQGEYFQMKAVRAQDQSGIPVEPYIAGHLFAEMMAPIALESGAAQLLNLKQGAFKLHGDVSYEQALYGMKLMYTLGQNMDSLIRALKDVHKAQAPVGV